MLSHNLNILKILPITVFIILNFSLPHCPIANDDIENNYNKIINALGTFAQQENCQNKGEYIAKAFQAFAIKLESDDEETRKLMNQWNEYLIRVSHFSCEDYFSAINKQQMGYLKAISILGDQIKNTNSQRDEYSSSWVDDLTHHFGIDFIENNRKAIVSNFLAIGNRSYHQYENELKDLIYIETMLFGSYKKYFDMFLEFYNEKIHNEGRKKLKSRKDAADAFLSIIGDISFANMHETMVLSENLADNWARNINEELFLFFKKHSLSRYYDYAKASDDLNAAIQSGKSEK
jgi:hypothetical protein